MPLFIFFLLSYCCWRKRFVLFKNRKQTVYGEPLAPTWIPMTSTVGAFGLLHFSLSIMTGTIILLNLDKMLWRYSDWWGEMLLLHNLWTWGWHKLSVLTESCTSQRSSSVYQQGEAVFLEAIVEGPLHPSLALYVDSCVATLKPDPLSWPRYKFISNHGSVCTSQSKITVSSSGTFCWSFINKRFPSVM